MSRSTQRHTFLSFDVGEKRIGVAQGDSEVRMPFPLTTILVDGLEMHRVRELLAEVTPSQVIVGYPRNQQGEATAQTKVSEQFANQLRRLDVDVVFQDESLTSVLAEQYLKKHKKSYTKDDIDSYAAAIILGDFLEQTYGY